MSYEKTIENVLSLAGCTYELLPNTDVWQWQQQWRAVYAAELHAQTGKWVDSAFDWEVFIGEAYPYKRGDRAWAEYRGLEPGPFLVLSAYIHKTFGFSCRGKPPDRLNRGIDLLIAPPSMEWTMSFDHEGYGPYFAKARP